MSNPETYSLNEKPKLARADKLLVIGALIMLLLFFAVFLSDDLFNFVFRINRQHSDRPVIGEIESQENEIRHRDSLNLTWQAAANHEKIRAGDGVFTGPSSSARVALKQGGFMELSENTLIIFREEDGVQFPQLQRGNIVLNVQGKMKMRIQGQVTELDGQHSRIKVFYDKNKQARFQLLSGNATVKAKGNRKVELKPNLIASVQEPAVLPPPPPAAVPPGVSASSARVDYVHFDELREVYESSATVADAWTERPSPAERVNQPVLINWRNVGAVNRVYGEIAADPAFSTDRQGFESIGTSYQISRPRSGPNHWRVSTDRQHWSYGQFMVRRAVLPAAPPTLDVKSGYQILLGADVQAHFPIQSASPYPAYIVETSLSPTFELGKSKVLYTTQSEVHSVFRQPGEYYFRVRGINVREQLTGFSTVAHVNVMRPEMPRMPQLSQNDLHGFVNEPVGTRWAAGSAATAYSLEIFDSQGKRVHQNTLRQPSFQFKSARPGTFNYRVTARDAYKRVSKSAQGTISVETRVAAQPPPPPAPVPARAPAQSLATKLDTPEDRSAYRNELYSSSTLDLEGAGFAMYSRQQLAHPEVGDPFAYMLGLRAHYNLNSNNAVGGSFMAKVANANAAGGITSPVSSEVRYEHSWAIPFNPFFSFHEMRIATIAGVEDYHNTGNGYFSQGYDLLKLGLGLKFPAFHRFDTGGELLYGFNGQSDKKYEIAGYLHYYLKKNWSLGVGYRIHLFDAGSESSAAGPLPYREGYGEGYSVLRMHY